MLYFALVYLVLFVSNQVNSAGAGGWKWTGRGVNVSNWADYDKRCGGKRQSPIDIQLGSTTCEESLSLEWSTEEVHFAIINDGRTLVGFPFDIDHNGGQNLANLEVLHHTNDTIIRLENPFFETYQSPVHKQYCFDSMHFHFGDTSVDGSEHTVNGQYYPLELHFVHYSCDYDAVSSAAEAFLPNGSHIVEDDDHVLSVVGVLFEIGDPNPTLDLILSDTIVDGIASFDTAADAQLIQLFYTGLIDPIDFLPENKEFVAYSGSLTTPPCIETVRWNVLKDTVTVSEAQMVKFRSLLGKSQESLAPNWRPTLEMNGRTLYECKEQVEAEYVEIDKETLPGKSWSYYRVDDWPELYPECGGLQQSPINVLTASDCESTDYLQLQWTSETLEFGIRNTGYSLNAVPLEIDHENAHPGELTDLEVLHHSNDTKVRLKNAFYNTYRSNVHEEYCFHSLHMHWGMTDEEGSEHAIDGFYSPLEIHLVHHACDYNVAGKAIQEYTRHQEEGDVDDNHVFAVIGILFDIGEANPAIDAILSDTILDGVREYSGAKDEELLKIYLAEFNLADLVPEDRSYIGYKGSFTTPACLETVRWHVMRNKMTVSEEQMQKIRSLLSSNVPQDWMAPNYRPVLPLNYRTIYTCEQQVEEEEVTKNYDDSKSVVEIDDDVWFILAIVFMCMFALAMICVAILAYKLQNAKLNGDGYSTPGQDTYEPNSPMKEDRATHVLKDDTEAGDEDGA